jgi:SAM-dependent methyltransferase
MRRYREYDRFAWLYSHHWGGDFHAQVMSVLDRLLLRLLPDRAAVLDLCCGDGRLAGALRSRGFEVTGLDGSDEMLRYARSAAPGVRFVAADARAFRLDRRFDAAVSTFDSLNHVLTLGELRKVFQNVAAVLRSGGYFAFDLNREKAYTELWPGLSAMVHDDAVSIVESQYDRDCALATCSITLFRRSRAAWRRSDFTLTQRHHPSDEVVAGLYAAGFSPVACFDAAEDLAMTGSIGQHRTFYLARKPDPLVQGRAGRAA